MREAAPAKEDASGAPSRSPDRVRAMFGAIARRYDFANGVLSGGLDRLWRRRVAKIVQAWRPARILDLATGSGDLAIAMQTACPDAEVVGVDFCEAMLAEARRKGVRSLVLADALRLPFDDATFDVTTVAFGLRNMESWPRALSEMARILRPGGHCVILDFSTPPAPLRWVYRPYLHLLLPRLAAWLTGRRDAYEYLAASIEHFPTGAAMARLIEAAGFHDGSVTPISGGIVTIYTGCRPRPLAGVSPT